jgi:hypothetical protein
VVPGPYRAWLVWAGYLERILVGLIFASGRTMAGAHEVIDRILKEQEQQHEHLGSPRLKDLESQTECEKLLYIKAYITAMEAMIKAVKKPDLAAAENFHQKLMAELAAVWREQ